jgi:hypothetical protein
MMDPVIFYLNGAYRTWRQTKRGMLLRLATRKEIVRAKRFQQVTCAHDCVPPGCGHCSDFTILEDMAILRRLLEMRLGIDALFYVHQKAKQINDQLSARYPECREMSERTRPMYEKAEELMWVWASRELLKHSPDDIRSRELATKTSVEELTERFEKLKAEIAQ